MIQDGKWWCDLCMRLARQKNTKHTNTMLGIVEIEKGEIHTCTQSGITSKLTVIENEDGILKAIISISQRCRKCKSEQICEIGKTPFGVYIDREGGSKTNIKEVKK